jgi:hypothetical protein
MLMGSKTQYDYFTYGDSQVVPPEGRISRREQGQKSNHCRIASLIFQGQDDMCKTMKFHIQISLVGILENIGKFTTYHHLLSQQTC